MSLALSGKGGEGAAKRYAPYTIGSPVVDLKDWQKHTTYRGCEETDDVIKWFWTLVETLSHEEKSLLLKFATGMS